MHVAQACMVLQSVSLVWSVCVWHGAVSVCHGRVCVCGELLCVAVHMSMGFAHAS